MGLEHDTYQVTLAIAIIHKVSRVSSTIIRERISLPVCLVGRILRHQALELLDVYPRAIYAIARAEDVIDLVDKLVETIQRLWRASS
jgi:hypothetical protein